MKLFRYEPSEYTPKRFTLRMQFDSEKGTLSGTLGQAGFSGDVIREFNIDLKQWVGKIIDMTMATTEKGYELIVFDALKNYSLANGLPSTPDQRRHQFTRVLRMCVHENLDDSVILLRTAHEEIDGFENILEDGDVYLHMQNMARHDQLADYILKKARLKSEMLGVIDQRDSVSYLEAQVDILTRLVMRLHEGHEDPLVKILQLADEQSVLAIKGEEALALEFLKKKSWVRTVQKDYYEAKKALEETSPEIGDEV